MSKSAGISFEGDWETLEPLWPTTVGDCVVDGHYIWKCVAIHEGHISWEVNNGPVKLKKNLRMIRLEE